MKNMKMQYKVQYRKNWHAPTKELGTYLERELAELVVHGKFRQLVPEGEEGDCACPYYLTIRHEDGSVSKADMEAGETLSKSDLVVEFLEDHDTGESCWITEVREPAFPKSDPFTPTQPPPDEGQFLYSFPYPDGGRDIYAVFGKTIAEGKWIVVGPKGARVFPKSGLFPRQYPEPLYTFLDWAKESSSTQFSLTNLQVRRIALWREEQDRKALEVQGKKPDEQPNYGAIGGELTYRFTPTSLGLAVVVKHGITQNELDVSDYSNW